MKTRLYFFIILFICSIPVSFAHFPMLIHDSPFAELNQGIQLRFWVGHPYEQEYTDAPKPEKVVAILPSGLSEDITSKLTEWKYQTGEQSVTAWTIPFDCRQKGDTIIRLDGKPVVGANNSLYQEFLKIFVHVERQDGWRARTGQPLEIVPLTRPYGIEAGSVFTGRLMKGDQGVADAEIEIEQFLPKTPLAEDLPPDPFITKVVVTDPNGVFSCTLPNSGWWICAAYVEEAETMKRNEKEYTLSALAGIWIHVEEKFTQKLPE